jgi:hypothetical protein
MDSGSVRRCQAFPPELCVSTCLVSLPFFSSSSYRVAQRTAGTIRDGYVWGRGTMDDKSGVLAILSTAEQLLKQGWTPKRDMYFGIRLVMCLLMQGSVWRGRGNLWVSRGS